MAMAADWDEIQNIHRQATSCDPSTAALGMLITERPGVPSDQYVIYWFDSAHELSEFIFRLFPMQYCDIDEDDSDDELSGIFGVAEHIADAGIGPKTAIEILSLNAFVSRGVRIRWVGSFDELCTASGETEKQLVQWFRDGADNGAPIDPAEREAFREFCRNLPCL